MRTIKKSGQSVYDQKFTIWLLRDDLEVPAFEVFQNEDGVFDRRVETFRKGQRLEAGLQPRLLHLRYQPRVGEALVFKSPDLRKIRRK